MNAGENSMKSLGQLPSLLPPAWHLRPPLRLPPTPARLRAVQESEEEFFSLAKQRAQPVRAAPRILPARPRVKSGCSGPGAGSALPAAGALLPELITVCSPQETRRGSV